MKVQIYNFSLSITRENYNKTNLFLVFLNHYVSNTIVHYDIICTKNTSYELEKDLHQRVCYLSFISFIGRSNSGIYIIRKCLKMNINSQYLQASILKKKISKGLKVNFTASTAGYKII